MSQKINKNFDIKIHYNSEKEKVELKIGKIKFSAFTNNYNGMARIVSYFIKNDLSNALEREEKNGTSGL